MFLLHSGGFRIRPMCSLTLSVLWFVFPALAWFQKCGDETYVSSGYCRVVVKMKPERLSVK